MKHDFWRHINKKALEVTSSGAFFIIQVSKAINFRKEKKIELLGSHNNKCLKVKRTYLSRMPSPF